MQLTGTIRWNPSGWTASATVHGGKDKEVRGWGQCLDIYVYATNSAECNPSSQTTLTTVHNICIKDIGGMGLWFTLCWYAVVGL